MAISEAYTDAGTTISTTEYSLTNDSTTIATQTADGVYQAFLDLSAMAAGDEYRVRVYDKVDSAGTQRVIYEATLIGVQSQIFVTPPLLLIHGWDFTLDKIAGTDRSIRWSIRKIA